MLCNSSCRCKKSKINNSVFFLKKIGKKYLTMMFTHLLQQLLLHNLLLLHLNEKEFILGTNPKNYQLFNCSLHHRKIICLPRISPESCVVGKPCPLSEVPPAKIFLMRQLINITVTSTNHSGNLGGSKNRNSGFIHSNDDDRGLRPRVQKDD